MKILILEDEPLIAANLERMVMRVRPDAQVLAKLASVRETSHWIAHEPEPDLILADIQLSDGLSFKALEKMNGQTPVIFTTAFDEFALKAFRLNSIDYLLKPVDEAELKAAFDKLDRLQEKFRSLEFTEGLSRLMQGTLKQEHFKSRFLVYSGKSVLPVLTDEIAFFSKQEIIFLHDRKGKQFVTEYRSLDEIMELLDPSSFYRANRQFIIHGDIISKFETDYMGKIQVFLDVKDVPEIMISKDKAADFKRWIER